MIHKREAEVVRPSNGEKLKLHSLRWWAFKPLFDAISAGRRRTVNEISDYKGAAADVAGLLLTVLSKPGEHLFACLPEAVPWLVGGSVEGMGRREDGTPDVEDWPMEDVAAVLEKVPELNDFASIFERLKNSLAPVEEGMSRPLGGETPGGGASEKSTS